MMLDPLKFVRSLRSLGIEFYVGVPDSSLKGLCAYLSSELTEREHIIAANEGNAIAIAAGYYLSTGKIPAVYLQNAGEGNITNPIVSLTDKTVYKIPLLLIIGWRGQPGMQDEPQHRKQGAITEGLLDLLGIKHELISEDQKLSEIQLTNAIKYIADTGEPYALLVSKKTFSEYPLEHNRNKYELTREKALEIILEYVDEKDAIVSTTGKLSRELFEYRTRNEQPHDGDFLSVGSMGHCSQIALGIALFEENRRIYCLDGDGSVIMHMGGLAVIGKLKPNNYVHVVFNNGAHESVGGQPTAAFDISFVGVAKSCGYSSVYRAETEQQIRNIMSKITSSNGPTFLEVMVGIGSRKDLGRPTIKPVDSKKQFMRHLSKDE